MLEEEGAASGMPEGHCSFTPCGSRLWKTGTRAVCAGSCITSVIYIKDFYDAMTRL